MKREEKWYAAKGGMMGKRRGEGTPPLHTDNKKPVTSFVRANVDIGSYAKSGVRSVFSHDPFPNFLDTCGKTCYPRQSNRR